MREPHDSFYGIDCGAQFFSAPLVHVGRLEIRIDHVIVVDVRGGFDKPASRGDGSENVVEWSIPFVVTLGGGGGAEAGEILVGNTLRQTRELSNRENASHLRRIHLDNGTSMLS